MDSDFPPHSLSLLFTFPLLYGMAVIPKTRLLLAKHKRLLRLIEYLKVWELHCSLVNAPTFRSKGPQFVS